MGTNYSVISNSGASGTATALSARAGGFVGWNTSDSDPDGDPNTADALVGVISNSLAAGSASAGTSRAGGFAGVNGRTSPKEGVTITNSFSTGNASALGDTAGGFVGENRESVTFSYSTGQATAPTSRGGFIGVSDGGTVLNSFWNTQSSGVTTSAGGTGKTTAQMTSIGTYNNTATAGLTTAWAIVAATAFGEPDGTSSEVWGIGSGVNCGYPFLHWQESSVHSCPAQASSSSSKRERQASSPAIALDFQGQVGDPVAGAAVVTGGEGLAPGSTLTLVVRSTPQTLATGTVSDLGNFSTRAQLPALPPGNHTLTLTGIAPDGSTLSLVQSFTVGANGTITALGAPSGTQVGGLAATGPSDALGLMAGSVVALLVLGAGLTLVRARKARFLVRD